MKAFWQASLIIVAISFAILLQFLDLVKASSKPQHRTKIKASSVTNFLDWKNWRRMYRSCNPKKNPYTSPIEIFSSTAENVNKMQTLMIYSKAPEENVYFLSTFYDMDNIQMESFNIKLGGDDRIRDATYISGLGSDTSVFFESALIMFRPENDEEPLHERQGLHSIDGKEYPMEIMFNFETHMQRKQIQAHVMVELSDVENPAWKPILELFAELRQRIVNETCFGKKNLLRAQENLKSANALHKTALLKQNEDTQGLTYKRTVKDLQQVLDNLKGAGDETMEKLQKQQSDSLEKQQKCMQEVIVADEEIEKLENATLSLSTDDDDPNNYADLAKLNDQKSELVKMKLNLSACIQEEGNKADLFMEEFSRKQELLRKSRVGNESTDVFRSVKDISNLLNDMKEKLGELENVEKAYENAQRDLDDLISMPKRSVLVRDPFQISWLFPSNGGFYFYNGSSPIPPCKVRSEVIVFEKPITITEEQLNHFHEFPSFSQDNSSKIAKICEFKEHGLTDDSNEIVEMLAGMEKIRLQVPSIKPIGNRTVWYNPKNIQFRDDDGMHMKSSTRQRLKAQLNSAFKIKERIFIHWILITFSFARIYQ